jgi:hypothetical protein
MSAGMENPQRNDKLVLPWNLTEWIAQPTVLEWVNEEVGALDWGNPELIKQLRAAPSFQPKFFLSLLTFAYATGLCDSEDVVTVYYQDVVLKTLFPDQHPTAESVSKFRRDYRGLLKWCLLQVFKRALKERFSFGDALLPAGLRRYLVDTAAGRLDAARHYDLSSAG